MNLRPYQVRAIQKARDEYRKGSRDILLVAPTGSGKTILGATIAKSSKAKGSEVLWLAHREELVEQAKGKLPPDIHVTTIQRLVASGKRPEAGVVVFDEAHHFVAARWNEVAEHYKNALRIGLTATPQRNNGLGLGDMFSAMVVVASYSELIAEGFIVECDVIAPDGRQRTLSMSPEDAVRRYAWDRKSITFASTVPEAHRIAECLGSTAACIEGATKKDIRKDLIGAFRSGEIRHLVNVFVLTEGFDAPAADVCILARGCTVEAAYIQMVGRILRPSEGKERALLVDLIGACHEFGMPTMDREHALVKGKAPKRKVPPIWFCSHCQMAFAARPANGRCKACGSPLPVPKAIAVERRRLARKEGVKADDTKRKREAWARLIEEAKRRGYKPGWAWHRFRSRYGHAPPRA